MMGLSPKRRPPAVLLAAVVATSVLMGCREKTKPPTTKPARATTQAATTRSAAADVSEQNKAAGTASDPTAGPAKDVQLDKRRAWIAPVNWKDDLPPGLLIGGLFSGYDPPPEVRYRFTRNSLQWKNPFFFQELLGRLPGEYRDNDRFEVVRYYRRGNRIVLTYRRGKGDPGKVNAPRSVYLYAPLPGDLKPGKYAVEVVGADPKQKLPRLDYSFEVPDVATSPVQSEFEDIADFLEYFEPKLPGQWQVSWLVHCNIGPSRGTSHQGVWMRLCRPSWVDIGGSHWGWDVTLKSEKVQLSTSPQTTPQYEPEAYVAIMSKGYKAKAPRTKEMGPAREFAKWRGRRVFVWDDGTYWSGIIVAAFKAADNRSVAAKATPLSILCRDMVALLGELEPRLPAKWHVYEVQPMTMGFDQRLFSMAFVHKDKREVYGHREGAYLDLDTWPTVPKSVVRDGGNVPLATWRGQKIYLPRGGGGWPTHKADVLAALRASETDGARATVPDLHQDFAKRLHKAIAAKLPKNWTMQPMETGEVKPVHWPKGEGLHILAERKGFVPADWKRFSGGEVIGGRVHVWIMGKGYSAKGPQDGEFTASPAMEIERRHGRRVLIWGGGADWKDWKEDIQAALKTMPPTAAIKPTEEDQAAIKKLVALLKLKVPKGWQVTVTEGRVTPKNCWPGRGVLISIAPQGGQGGRPVKTPPTALWLMSPGYEVDEPMGMIGHAQAFAKTRARWIALWRGRPVFHWRDKKWPSEAIWSALAATARIPNIIDIQLCKTGTYTSGKWRLEVSRKTYLTDPDGIRRLITTRLFFLGREVMPLTWPSYIPTVRTPWGIMNYYQFYWDIMPDWGGWYLWRHPHDKRPTYELAVTAQATEVDGKRSGMYVSGAWTYYYKIAARSKPPLSRPSGRLLYAGKALPQPGPKNVGDYHNTPWGRIFWSGKTSMWLAQYKGKVGKELPRPSPVAQRTGAQPATQPAGKSRAKPATVRQGSPQATRSAEADSPQTQPGKAGQWSRWEASQTTPAYRLYLPKLYAKRRHWPLVVTFPQRPGAALSVGDRNAWQQWGDKNGWIVLVAEPAFPSHPNLGKPTINSKNYGRAWREAFSPTVAACQGLVIKAGKDLGIDRRRIIVVGGRFSGELAANLAVDDPGRFAGLALLSCEMRSDVMDPKKLAASKALKVLVSTAKEDAGYLRDGSRIANWLGRSGLRSVQLRTYSGHARFSPSDLDSWGPVAAVKSTSKPATQPSSSQAQPATRYAEPKRGEDPEILAVAAKLRTMKPNMQAGHLAGMIGRMIGLPGGGTFIDLPPDKGYTMLAYCLGDKDLSASALRVVRGCNPAIVRKVHARVVIRGNATELARVYNIMANNLANFSFMRLQFGGKDTGVVFVAAQGDARKHLAHRDPRVRLWAGQFLLHLVRARPDEKDRLGRHNVALAARIIDKDLKSNPEAFLGSLEAKAADMYPSHRGGYLYGRRLAFRDWLGGKTSTYEPSSDAWAKRPFIQGFRAAYAATMAALERYAKADAEQAGDSRELARTIAAIWALKLRQDPQKYLAEEDFGGKYDRFRASAAAGYLYGHKQGLRSLTPVRTGRSWPDKTKIYVPTAKAGDWPFIIGFLSGYRQTLLLGRPDPRPAGPAPKPTTRPATQPATRYAEPKRGEDPEILAVAAKLRTMEPEMRRRRLTRAFIDLPADKWYTLLAYCLGDKELSAGMLRHLRLCRPVLTRKLHARTVMRGNATGLAHVYNIMADSLANVSFLKSQPGKDAGTLFVAAQGDARKHLAHRDPRVRLWAGQFLLHLEPALPDKNARSGSYSIALAARIADKHLNPNPEAFLQPLEGHMYGSHRGGYLYGRRLAFRDWLGGKTNTYKPSRAEWAKPPFIQGFRAGYAATMAALKRHAKACAEQAGDSHDLARTIAAIPAAKLRQDPQEYLVREDLGDKYDRFWASSAAGYLYGHRQALRCLSLLSGGDRTWKTWPDRTKIYIRTVKAGDCPFVDGFLSGYRQTLLLGRPDPRQGGPASRPTTRRGTTRPSSPQAQPAAKSSSKPATVRSAEADSPQATRSNAADSPQAKAGADAGKVSRVKSLAQLRSLTPVRKAKDWELRVGWADSGIENAPWKLLYLHWIYTGDRKERPRPIPIGGGYHHRVFNLGPVAWDMHYTPPNRRAVRRQFMVNRSPPSQLIRSSTERLYCAVVPTPLAGTYELTIGGKVPVIATIPVKKAPELSWLPLLVPRPGSAKPGDAALTMAGELVAATPAYHEDPVFFRSGVPRAGDEQKLFAKMLPGQCPGLANWRLYENDKQTLGIHARMTPLRLSAEIAAGKLLLHYKGFTPQQPDREFLAQWRINGKVVTAEPPGEERRPQPFAPQLKAVELSRKKENEEATVEIPLVLPAWLARRAEAGDKVALTVLFSPTGWRRIVHPANITSRSNLSRATIGCSQPVMSGQVTFTVTKAMLAEAHAAAAPAVKSTSQPATTRPRR